ncbi:MAG: DUF192 domain-containing protein [Chloroflexi bacterium]|nr:DUF192 domain-containing protein [Chloroflexota bacterium]
MPKFRSSPLALVCLAGALIVVLGAPRLLGGLSGCERPYVEFDAPSGPRVWVELADDPEKRGQGLMFRQSLGQDEGMLFIFERPGRAAFWMKNTLIPLSIAFIARDGATVDIQDMEPGSLEPHAPPADYLYALEVNAGWFATHSVGPATRARLCLT